MPKQHASPGLRDAMKKKQPRRELFLKEIYAVVPGGRLLALIVPHYPKVGLKCGRPPMPLATMLRVYFLQNWYARRTTYVLHHLLGRRLRRHRFLHHLQLHIGQR